MGYQAWSQCSRQLRQTEFSVHRAKVQCDSEPPKEALEKLLRLRTDETARLQAFLTHVAERARSCGFSRRGKQVRLNWKADVTHALDVVQFTSDWQLATPEAISTLSLLAQAANGMYGAGSHWVETRELLEGPAG